MDGKILTHEQAWEVLKASVAIKQIGGKIKVDYPRHMGGVVSIFEDFCSEIHVVEYETYFAIVRNEIYTDWEMFAIAYGLV